MEVSPHDVFTSSNTQEEKRYHVWNRYIGNNIKGKCFACDSTMHAMETWESGHVQPRSKGGVDDISNLRPIHARCNRKMGVEHMDEFRKRIDLPLLSSPRPVEAVPSSTKKLSKTEKKEDSYFYIDEDSTTNRLRLLSHILPYNPDHPLPQHTEVLEFLKTVYPDPELLEYVLTAFASCMEGSYKQKKFFLLCGNGSTAKTTVLNLLFATFQELAISLSSKILSGKPLSAKERKNLELLPRKYVGQIESPREGNAIDPIRAKNITDGILLAVESESVHPSIDVQFPTVFFMECRELPGITSTDNELWSRLRVIPHTTKFVDTDVSESTLEHRKEPSIADKIRDWAPYFASILAYYYETAYLTYGLKYVPKVIENTLKWRQQNDSIYSFCMECLKKEAGSEVLVRDVVIHYKHWCSYNCGIKCASKSELLSRLTELYETGGNSSIDVNRLLIGVRLIEEGE